MKSTFDGLLLLLVCRFAWRIVSQRLEFLLSLHLFKVEFPYPVYTYVFRIPLGFSGTYIGSFMERIFITLKMQCNDVNACGNGMWQLGFKQMEWEKK